MVSSNFFQFFMHPLLLPLASLHDFNSEIRINSNVLENTFEYFVKVINEFLYAIGQVGDDLKKQKEAVQTTSSTVFEMGLLQ